MEILSVNNENINEVVEFLKSINSIKDVDINVVRNASFIKDEKDIIGILSYEAFGTVALIRYFVFRKVVSEEIVLELLNGVIKDAKKEGLSSLITLVVKDDIANIFKELGFHRVDSQKVFIDESSLLSTKFKDSIVMQYQL